MSKYGLWTKDKEEIIEMKKLNIVRRPHHCKGIGMWCCAECETLMEKTL